MPYADNQGVAIRYEQTGNGPAVLLHHGGGLRLESWALAGWVEPLSSGYQVVSFDARGHGASDKPDRPEDYALELMVGDVLAVADACGAEFFHLLGWSMGAKVAWGVAETEQDRFGSVTMIGADPEASDASAEPMIELIEQGMAVAADALTQTWDMPDWALEQFRSNDQAAMLAYFRSAWPDLTDVPAQLRVPTLLLCGTEDAVFRAMQRAAHRCDSAELVALEGHDHVSGFLTQEAIDHYMSFLARVA